jgi:hypothetical protein
MYRDWRFPLKVTAWLIATMLVNAATASGLGEPARPRSAQPLVELDQLAGDVSRLQAAIADLTTQATTLAELARDVELAAADLTGHWKLSLPAGFTYPAEISEQADGRLHLQVRGVMRGIYVRDGRRMRVDTPSDPRLTEFVWEATNANRFVLVESPAVAKIGADYRGATLTRVVPSPAE